MMVHSSTTLQPQSIPFILGLEILFGFEIWAEDLRQEYLQLAEPLIRDIFIKNPTKEFELEPSKCLQLLKPLYGLCESEDMWHDKLDRKHLEDLGMKIFRIDSALHFIFLKES